MNNMSRMQKLVILLIIIMIGSFVIAGIIFYAQYGVNNFASISDAVKPANAINVDEQKTAPTAGLNNLVVGTSSDDVKLIPSDTNEIRAHFHGYYASSSKDFKPEFKLVTSGDTTTVTVDWKSHFGALSFSSNLVLDIYVPRTYNGNIEVRTSSANVNAGEFNLDNFKCRTTSGDFSAAALNAKKAELECSSGNMNISGAYDSFSFRSTSGDFNTNGIKAGTADLQASSGNIRGSINAGELSLRTTSGDIISDNLTANSLKLDTNSGTSRLRGNPGSVEARSTSGDITLEYSQFAANISVNTTSGNTNIKLPENAQFHLTHNTNSGSSNCAFPITVTKTSERGIDGTVGGDSNTIKVNSTSGDMNINK